MASTWHPGRGRYCHFHCHPQVSGHLLELPGQRKTEKRFLTLFSDHDPIMRGGERAFQQHVHGAAGQPHSKVSGGHFLQDDSGPELARRINELIVADAQSRVTREPQPTL
jgi:predicted DNA-binding protein with PD1-like motif